MKLFIKSTVINWINLCRLLNENIMSIACRKISKIWRLPGVSWRKYLIKIRIICHVRGSISITRYVMIKKRIAESFNSFFVNVGPNLAKNMPSASRSPTGYMERNPSSMAVIPASQNEIITIRKNLKKAVLCGMIYHHPLLNTHAFTLLSPLCMYQTCLSHKVFFRMNSK